MTEVAVGAVVVWAGTALVAGVTVGLLAFGAWLQRRLGEADRRVWQAWQAELRARAEAEMVRADYLAAVKWAERQQATCEALAADAFNVAPGDDLGALVDATGEWLPDPQDPRWRRRRR